MKANTSKVTTLTLGESGDLAAPPGSQPWAIAVRLQIQSLLKDNGIRVKQLRTWLEAIEQHSGYRLLTDENGRSFCSYVEFCKAKQPWGLGYPPEEIDKILKELESESPKVVDIEEKQSRNWGDLEQYLQRFSKVIDDCMDNKCISIHQIAKILNIHIKNAYKWRKRWLDLGWIESLPGEKKGIYQITDDGIKQVNQWLEESPSNDNEALWLTIPRGNPKKAAEKLVSSLEAEKLQEIHELIGKVLDKQ